MKAIQSLEKLGGAGLVAVLVGACSASADPLLPAGAAVGAVGAGGSAPGAATPGTPAAEGGATEESSGATNGGSETNDDPGSGDPGPSDPGSTDPGPDQIFVDAGQSRTGPGDATCGASTIPSDPIPGEVLVIFDQSLSMSQTWGSKPKWLAASDALVAGISSFGDSLSAGALFVPNFCPASTPGRPKNCTDDTGTGPCSLVYPITDPLNIQIQPGTLFVDAWVKHFQPPWTTISGTPWDKAFAEANSVFATPSPTGAQRAVVLVSDGAPTCPIGDSSPTIPLVQTLLANGIKTYVIGVPGASDASAVLNTVAAAGGTTQYIDASAPADLTKALTDLSKKILGCVFDLEPPPVLDDVHLVAWDPANPTGAEIPQGADTWNISADGKTATLVGATCDKATAGGFDELQFIFGCPEAVIGVPR